MARHITPVAVCPVAITAVAITAVAIAPEETALITRVLGSIIAIPFVRKVTAETSETAGPVAIAVAGRVTAVPLRGGLERRGRLRKRGASRFQTGLRHRRLVARRTQTAAENVALGCRRHR